MAQWPAAERAVDDEGLFDIPAQQASRSYWNLIREPEAHFVQLDLDALHPEVWSVHDNVQYLRVELFFGLHFRYWDVRLSGWFRTHSACIPPWLKKERTRFQARARMARKRSGRPDSQFLAPKEQHVREDLAGGEDVCETSQPATMVPPAQQF